MKAVKQKHLLGCAVACVAFLANTEYEKALELFDDGENKAATKGFFCKEIVTAIKKVHLNYEYRYVMKKDIETIKDDGMIVYIKKSPNHPGGHYLCWKHNKWMDSWVNYPSLEVQAGFHENLPGKAQYAIIRTD